MAKRKKGKKGHCALISGTLEFQVVTETSGEKAFEVTKPSGKTVTLPPYLFDFLFDIVTEPEEDASPEEEDDAGEA